MRVTRGIDHEMGLPYRVGISIIQEAGKSAASSLPGAALSNERTVLLIILTVAGAIP